MFLRSFPQLIFTNLTTNAWYTIRLSAATASLYTPDRLLEGPASAPQRVRLRANCDLVQAFSVLEQGREGGSQTETRRFN